MEKLDDDQPAFAESKNANLQLRKEIMGDPRVSTQMYHNLHRLTRTAFEFCGERGMHTTIFERNNETGRIVMMKNKKHLFISKFHIIFHWTYAIVNTLYFGLTVKRNNLTDKLLAFCFLSSYICCAVIQSELWFRRDDAIFMWRSILEFEEKYLKPKEKGKKTKKDLICVLLMSLGIVSYFGLPGMFTLLLLVNPCRPPHVGYMLFKDAQGICQVPTILHKLFTVALDGYFWAVALTPGLLYVFQGLLVGVRAQDCYLRVLRYGYVAPPTKTMTKEKKESECLKIYQELLLLNKVFNDVFRPVFFPIVIVVGLIVLIVGVFAVLKLRHMIPFPSILFFPCISADGMSIIACTKIASLAYLQSNKFLKMAKGNREYPMKSEYRKKLLAMDNVKIRFGGNYVDESTALVFLDFALSQIVSLMLMTDSKRG